MKYFELDKEEKEILDAIENDELVFLPISKSELEKLKDVAKNTFAKSVTTHTPKPQTPHKPQKRFGLFL